MRKYSIILLSLFLLFSCKAKYKVKENSANETLTANKVIQFHYDNGKDFQSINIRANAKYRDEKQSHSVTADIRIKKDEIIWINIKLLGFPVAKAIITPNKVSYYEKINNTYFDGNFDVLSNWLGTALDFDKVQNLFLGNAIDDLTKGNYVAKIENEYYKLTERLESGTTKEFYFEGANFLVKKETIIQSLQKRSLEVHYPSHTKINNIFIPNSITIRAKKEEEVKIDLDYKNITFDEKLNYSFSIPNGYEEIIIN